ncbi:annexin A6-like [Lineus longissimus]|uniref:annexin A6-like n=1 Tax=Lineus longissimus TaxID=88925 RepID=UPI002B4E096F
MSKLLKKKWEERAYQQHMQKIQAAKGGVDSKPPRRFPHLQIKTTKIKKEEEKLAEVHYQNQILVQRLTGIMGRRASVDSQQDSYARSLNLRKREKEAERIYKSNQAIARRLESIKPVINSREQEEDFRKHKEYRKLRTDSTKMYPEYSNEREERDNFVHVRRRSRSLDGSEDVYFDYGDDDNTGLDDDDGEGKPRQPDDDDDEVGEDGLRPSDYAYLYSDDDDEMPEEKWMKKKNQPQPQLKNADGQPVKLPKIENRRDYFGNVQHQHEMDARALFRACKFNSAGNFEETLTKGHGALLKRTPQHRAKIKEKYTELFDLSLEDELKKVTKPTVHPFITALLTARGGLDDAEELQAALSSGSVPRLIHLFCSRSKSSLNSLQNSYKSKYKKTVDTALTEVITDPDVHTLLLLLLRKDGRHDYPSDDVLAKTDARKLYMSGKGKWTDEDGAFLKIVSTRSYPQISATMTGFRGVAGRPLGEAAEEDIECSSEYSKAIKAFGNMMVDKEGVSASQLRLSMKNPDKFIKLMVVVSDGSDLSAIKDAYKEKYGIELENDIRNKYRGEQLKLLLALCEKRPPPKAKVKTKDATSFPLPVKQKRFTTNFSSKKVFEEPQRDSPPLTPSPPLSPKKQTSPLLSPTKLTEEKANKKAVRWDDSASGSTESEDRPDQQGSQPIQKIAEESSTNDDCEHLYEAMCGFGTDEDVITDILAQRTNKQRQKIRDKYADLYDKKLISDLKSELSGNYEELILSLMMAPTEYLAHSLHHDISEAEMEADALISIIHSIGSKEIENMKKEYKRAHNIELVDDLKERGNGDFKNMMLALLKDSSADESGKEKLDKLGESLKDAPSHFVQLIQNSFDGFGTDERPLIRIIVSRSEVDLGAIKKQYKEKYGKSLVDAVRSETSGDFKDCLLAIVNKS